MVSPARLSCLGCPGWGPLHLRLRRHGEPQAVARRLRQALAASAGRTDGRLLASLLRTSPDLEPWRQPWPFPGCCAFHYRLVWVKAAVVRISAWRGLGSRLEPTVGVALPIDDFLLTLSSCSSRHCIAPGPVTGLGETRVETILGLCREG